jgi:hypothetical protein
MAYKGRIGTKETERHYPHIVELVVPLNGFGTKLNVMHDWHFNRGANIAAFSIRRLKPISLTQCCADRDQYCLLRVSRSS